VRELTRHPAFERKNPNRVRALVGAFTQANQLRFHDASGAGYHLLADEVIGLDPLNPTTAARLVQPLGSWRRHDAVRQALMRRELERVLATPDLSKTHMRWYRRAWRNHAHPALASSPVRVTPSLDGRYDLLTLGETLLRLSPPGQQRLDQARLFEIGVGGSELMSAACSRGWDAGSPGCRGCLWDRSPPRRWRGTAAWGRHPLDTMDRKCALGANVLCRHGTQECVRHESPHHRENSSRTP